MMAMGIITGSPFATLYPNHDQASSGERYESILYILDVIVNLAIAVRERPVQRYHVVLLGNPVRHRHGRMYAQRLAHDEVEIRQGVQLVHRRRVGADSEELRAQFALDVRGLGQREEAPHGRAARGLVAGDDEAGCQR